MQDLLKRFILERETTNSEGMIYIGTIDGQKAILIFPNTSVPKTTMQHVLSMKKDLTQHNDVFYTFRVTAPLNVFFRVVYPASDRLIAKYTSEYVLVKETYENYLAFIANHPDVDDNWMENLVKEKNPKEHIYYQDHEIMIIPDFKWDRESMSSLHLLAIFKADNLRCIRDVTDHKIIIRAEHAIVQVLLSFGLTVKEVFMFFHYRPTNYRLHIHIVNVKIGDAGFVSAMRAIPIHDVIHNLKMKMDSDYYKRDMFVLIKREDEEGHQGHLPDGE